jgi:hypothetical protein
MRGFKMADKASKTVQRLAEKAVRLHVEGMSPDDALYSVAKEASLSPPFIERVAEGFNLSSAVAHLASSRFAEKKAGHAMVDAAAVIRRLYGDVHMDKAASAPSPVEVPILQFDRPKFDKTASTTARQALSVLKEHLTLGGMVKRIEKCAAAHAKVMKDYREKEAALRLDIDIVVDELAREVRTMTDEQFQKNARLIVNGYGDRGDAFVKALSNMSGRSCEGVQRTARNAVFPLTPFFSKVARAQELRLAHVKARRDREGFERYMSDMSKEGGLGSTFAMSNMIGSAAGRAQAVGDMRKLFAPDDPMLDLEPRFINALRETEARRNFLSLLYAPELKERTFDELVDAYNDVVSVAPELGTRPGPLKAYVIQRIQAGSFDPYVAGAMVKTTGDMEKTRLETRKLSLAERADRSKTDKGEVLTSMVDRKKALKDADKPSDKPKTAAKPAAPSTKDSDKEKAKQAERQNAHRMLFTVQRDGNTLFSKVREALDRRQDIPKLTPDKGLDIMVRGLAGDRLTGADDDIWTEISSML